MAGIANDIGVGREERFISVAESAGNFNGVGANYAAPVVGGSLAIKEYNFTPNQPRENRRDASGSRSLFQRITRMKENSWSLSHFVFLPGGNTPPQWDSLVAAAMGASSDGTTQRDFTLSNTPGSLALHAHLGGDLNLFSEALAGSVVEEWTLDHPGTEEPTMSYTGQGARWIPTGGPSVETVGQTGTLVTVGTTDIGNFKPDGFIQVGTDLNLRIISVDEAAGTMVVDTSFTSVASDVVAPFTPWVLTNTQPQNAIEGQLDLASRTDLQIVSFNQTLTNGWEPKTPAFKNEVDDYIVGYRDIAGEIGLYGRSEDFRELSRLLEVASNAVNADTNKRTATSALTVTIGDPAAVGARMVLTYQGVELDFGGLTVPEGPGFSTITLPFVALASAAGANDELVVFTD